MPTLSEAESKRLLAAHGLPFVPEREAASPDEAAAAAAQLGFPVAVKLNAPGLAHKTERGLVRLGMGDADAVRRAAAELLGAAAGEDGRATLLVARMVRGSRELIAGLHRDDHFGMCVMVGVGGVLAEAVADVAFRLVPLDRVDAEELLEDLRLQAVLGPFRGEPALDRARLVDAVMALAALARAVPDVVSVDLNPLIVRADDGAPVAVDALVEVA